MRLSFAGIVPLSLWRGFILAVVVLVACRQASLSNRWDVTIEWWNPKVCG